MKHSVEDRADRLMRRRHGWHDRGAYYWAGAALSIALRDAERSLFARFGTNVKPDWSAGFRPLVIVSAAYCVFVAGMLVADLLGWVR